MLKIQMRPNYCKLQSEIIALHCQTLGEMPYMFIHVFNNLWL